MFSRIGTPELVTAVILVIAVVGIVLHWRGGGRRMM